MKKAFTFIAAVAFVASLSSCKKDWTCTCTSKDSSDSSYSATFTYTFNAKKKDAEAACEVYNVTAGTLSTSCDLKKK